jgi:hypothetical protein
VDKITASIQKPSQLFGRNLVFSGLYHRFHLFEIRLAIHRALRMDEFPNLFAIACDFTEPNIFLAPRHTLQFVRLFIDQLDWAPGQQISRSKNDAQR